MSDALLALVPVLRAELASSAPASAPLCVARARLRRVDGVLAVLSSRLLWSALSSPSSSSSSLVSVPLTALKRVLVNAAADASAGALLKLELDAASGGGGGGGGTALVLQFETPQTRDEVRALLAGRSAAAAAAVRGADGGAGADAAELTSDPRLLSDATLRALYTELVLRGPLSAAEFWSQPQLSAAVVAAPRDAGTVRGGSVQTRGLPSTLPSARDAVVQPSSESAEHVQYELTPARVHQLFVTYAGLQRAYVRLVPAQMTEEQFWTRFFQSQHYRLRSAPESKGSKTRSLKRERSDAAAEDVFALAQLEAAETQARRDRLRHVLRDNDLTRDTDARTDEHERDAPTPSDAKLSAREYKRSTRYQQQLELIRKVNRHAALLVESLAQDELAQPPTKRARLSKDEEQSADLRTAPATAETPAAPPSALTAPAATAASDAPPAAALWSRLPRLVLHSAALAPRVSRVRLSATAVLAPAAPASGSGAVVSELTVRRVHELLRHWWSAVRGHESNKLTRLRPSLEGVWRELTAHNDAADASAQELGLAVQRALADTR